MGILPGDSKMREYPVPCSSSAPLTVENRCRSFLPDVFFPCGNPLRPGAGLKGQCGPGSLWVFLGVWEVGLGGWRFYTAPCEVSKGKGSATSQAFLWGPGTPELLGGREEEASVQPSSVLLGGGGGGLLSSPRQSSPGPGAHPLWSTPGAGYDERRKGTQT